MSERELGPCKYLDSMQARCALISCRIDVRLRRICLWSTQETQRVPSWLFNFLKPKEKLPVGNVAPLIKRGVKHYLHTCFSSHPQGSGVHTVGVGYIAAKLNRKPLLA